MRSILFFVVFLLGTQAALAANDSDRRAVLITGASSGIGNLTARTLAENGFFVYAGARSEEDLAALNAIDHVQGVRLDVTVAADIEAAVETVREGGRGLYAVVNNAGVAVVGPLAEASERDMDFVMDVNVYGPWRVTRAFMPLLLESKGRVITIGSGLGVMVYPLTGIYNMSKHAVEAFSDTLRMEMGRFDVQSAVIEPGAYKSKIDQSLQERMKERGFDPEGSLYEKELASFIERDASRPHAPEPAPVARSVLRALEAERMQPRYLVAPDLEQTRMVMKAAVDKVVQLNRGNGFEMSRAELIEMLDQSLSQHGGEDE